VFLIQDPNLSSVTSSLRRITSWLRSERRPIWKLIVPKFSSQEEKDWLYKEASIVYQFLEVNLEKAQAILDCFNPKEKKSGFKKVALVLHPDKNKHPKSKEAFQKALEIFNK